MPLDKYSAVWVSNSSISDFLNCPRLYYLRNVYKDPITRHKVNIISPALVLGQTVHEVLEGLSINRVKAEDRFKESLLDKFDVAFEKFHGKLGGFKSEEEEAAVKQRGRDMIQRVIDNPGPFLSKAVRIEKELPNYYLSEEENIILCGKIDWLEYIPEDDSVHIIDFKTGRNDEKADSLQLPIYHLLVRNCQKRKVSKASYWYLDREDVPNQVNLPSVEEAFERVFAAAKKVKAARLRGEYACPRNGCFGCRPFEAILQKEAEFVGVGGYSQDMYIL
jgi:ATP-dependent helicase/DNAse subunit B